MPGLYETPTLVVAAETVATATSFLRERYFPHDSDRDLFASEKVLIEFKDGDRGLAPFVAPRINGITILRKGHESGEYEPANIAPKYPLTADVLKKRRMGESLYPNATPEERAQYYIYQDIQNLDNRITRTEEYMAAQVMLNNGIVMRHETDKEGVYEENEIRFYAGASNPSEYTPSLPWSDADAPILADLSAMVNMLAEAGLPADDFTCAPDVVQNMKRNNEIKEMLKIEKLNIVNVDPKELVPGVSLAMTLNIDGRVINVFSYAAKYKDDEGVSQQFIPTGKGIMTSPSAGHTMYGAITQLEKDDEFHTYPGRRVPQVITDRTGNTRDMILKSNPLMAPHNKNPWVVVDTL